MSGALTDVVISTLARIENQLIERARLSQLNALLALGDPAFVLPSPAVALVALQAGSTITIDAQQALRSLNPIGVDGEVLLTPVFPNATVHPWTVVSTEWLTEDARGAEVAPARREALRVVKGCRVVLGRPAGSSISDGALSLHFDLGESYRGSLDRTIVTSGQTTCRVTTLPGAVRLLASGADRLGPAHHYIGCLARNILLLDLTDVPENLREVPLEIRFPHALPVPMETAAPRVTANAIIAWNSVDCSYPEQSAFEQSVSETRHRCVHPLSTRHIGPAWRAWSVERVGLAGHAHSAFVARNTMAGSESDGSEMHYYMACAPLPNTAAESEARLRNPDERATLSVVIPRDTRILLDERREHLRVAFRSTEGARANGIPADSEFQLIELSGLPTPARVTGHLMTTSWGGHDGIAADLLGEEPIERLHAFFPRAPRSVGDVATLVEHIFGNALELVDPADLVRFGAADRAEPLMVRVRFKPPFRSRPERAALLEACQSVLADYLRSDDFGGFCMMETSGIRTGSES